MDATERRILFAILVLVFSALYVASWFWLHPGELQQLRIFE